MLNLCSLPMNKYQLRENIFGAEKYFVGLPYYMFSSYLVEYLNRFNIMLLVFVRLIPKLSTALHFTMGKIRCILCGSTKGRNI